MVDGRYVTKRVNRQGIELYYWQRKPFPLTRLPDDPQARAAAANELNQLADVVVARQKAHPEKTKGTVAWCAKQYLASQKWRELAEGTKGYYQRHITNLVSEFGQMAIGDLTRGQLIDFIDRHSESQHRHIAAVASRLFQVGQRHDFTEVNPTVRLDLASSQARDAIWDADSISRYLSAVKEHPHKRPLAVAFFVMLFTAQRPSDVLALRRDKVHTDSILVRQKKTKTWVEIPIHTSLRPVLEYAYEVPSEYVVCDDDGAPAVASSFRNWTLTARVKAGVDHLEMRDLRRTSIVIMGEAGVPVQQIAAISGHSIATVEHIMRVYMPRTKFMADAAIKTWEEAGSQRLTGIDTKELQYAPFPRED